jgi:hypothetical protein
MLFMLKAMLKLKTVKQKFLAICFTRICSLLSLLFAKLLHKLKNSYNNTKSTSLQPQNYLF